jgi:hypothetical protein
MRRFKFPLCSEFLAEALQAHTLNMLQESDPESDRRAEIQVVSGTRLHHGSAGRTGAVGAASGGNLNGDELQLVAEPPAVAGRTRPTAVFGSARVQTLGMAFAQRYISDHPNDTNVNYVQVGVDQLVVGFAYIQFNPTIVNRFFTRTQIGYRILYPASGLSNDQILSTIEDFLRSHPQALKAGQA